MLIYHILKNKELLIEQHIFPLDGFYNDTLAKAAADMLCADKSIKPIKEPVLDFFIYQEIKYWFVYDAALTSKMAAQLEYERIALDAV